MPVSQGGGSTDTRTEHRVEERMKGRGWPVVWRGAVASVKTNTITGCGAIEARRAGSPLSPVTGGPERDRDPRIRVMPSKS